PGLRYDLHSDYANRLTPKLAIQHKASPRLSLNFSYGSGFKAPDFRQLYLYYVNPAAQGYRVYGASEFSARELEQQLEDGLIARILPEAYQITALRPEIGRA
ncbi:TonB-dependent receptor, partial [Arthrospira platensis SPKY1]|nr:TonB-dependent receptor [Arthrospira platensis SPKY1]